MDVRFCQMLSLYLWKWSHDFFLSLLMWWIILIDFWLVNQPCIPGINPTRLCWADLFIYWWIWFANIFRIFASMFLRNICHYKKIVVSLSGFGIKYFAIKCCLHRMSQEVFSASIFWKRLENCSNSFLKCLIKFCMWIHLGLVLSVLEDY